MNPKGGNMMRIIFRRCVTLENSHAGPSDEICVFRKTMLYWRDWAILSSDSAFSWKKGTERNNYQIISWRFGWEPKLLYFTEIVDAKNLRKNFENEYKIFQNGRQTHGMAAAGSAAAPCVVDEAVLEEFTVIFEVVVQDVLRHLSKLNTVPSVLSPISMKRTDN